MRCAAASVHWKQRCSLPRALTAQGWQLLPVMSFAARQDTRFGTGNYWKEQLEAAAGYPVLDTLQAVEPLGPRKMAQALVVAPAPGPRFPGWRRACPTRR